MEELRDEGSLGEEEARVKGKQQETLGDTGPLGWAGAVGIGGGCGTGVSKSNPGRFVDGLDTHMCSSGLLLIRPL